ncbi:MAG: hypothetical protein ETSY1_13940 [Candidatus Entotheonella factor]|uniref:Glycosyl hydrolases family 2 sugar binding domain-containing protein n=1 Tax=Entotheonella factor TaxID=1429438 RepID=W4LPC1_ENTF1|nr:MAG: hypothetical protein ETSY1_13940 [Candidatus Entotheonella factor]
MTTPHHVVGPPVIIAATPVRPLPSPQPAIAPALPPVCAVDLMTVDGSAMFGAQWKTKEAKIIEVPAIPDAMPEFETTYDIDPHAGEAGFDDSAWPTILPTELEAKRGGGKVSFLWFRTTLTIPTRLGDFDPMGAQAVLALCIDDYAEIWVNGELPRAAGRPSPATVQGFNMPQRLVLSAAVSPGDTFELAVFAINGPISAAHENTVWFREARVEFY